MSNALDQSTGYAHSGVPDEPPAGTDQPEPARGPSRVIRVAVAIRPLLFAVAAGILVMAIVVLGTAAHMNPFSPRTQYGLRVAPIVVAVIAVAAGWWARRRGHIWDADLLPALFGGLTALTLATALHGTPFGIDGLNGDQTYRTENVTRFADSWWGGDYTYRGLPAYYAPLYFWTLGRTAALAHVAPWHMLKLGVIAVAFVAPLVSYLMWRPIVAPRTAALISVATVPLVTTALIEPYDWIALLVFLPWWLQVGHGLGRSDRPRSRMVVLGLIGSLLFCLYYYYFYLIPIALLLHIVVAKRRGEFSWRELRRTFAILGIAALGSAPFWAPLGWSFLTAPAFESLNNRWMTVNSGLLALPMLEPSVLGALCMTGLVFLVVTARERLSRSLLLVLISTYVWHAVGFLFTVVGEPLMSFRMRDLVEPILLSAAALALVRLVRLAAAAAPNWRLPTGTTARLVAAAGILLAIFVGDQYVGGVLGKPFIQAAHNQPLPGGKLPPFHDPSAKTQAPGAASLAAIIDSEYTGGGHPVVLTDRTDLMAYYPYFGFLQWNANYSHPTAQYRDRLAFLADLARSGTSAEFAQRSGANPYDRIDAIVLSVKKDSLVFKTADDAFPFGTKTREVDTPKSLVASEYFRVSLVDGYLVAVRR